MIKQNCKNGISLIVLVVSIVVLLILIGATVYRSESSRITAQRTVLITDLTTIENSAKAYYVENNDFPTPKSLTKNYYTAEDIRTLNDDVNIINDIYYFNDINSKFYIIDLSKIDIKNINFGLKYDTYGDTDVFVISDINKKVYYLKGKTMEGNKYYALTERLTGAESNTTYRLEDTSSTSISSSNSSGRIQILNSGLDARAVITLKNNESIELKTDSYTKKIDKYVGKNILIIKNLLTTQQLNEIKTTNKYKIVLKSGDLIIEEKEIDVTSMDYSLRFNSSLDKVNSYNDQNTISFNIESSNEIALVKYVYYTLYDLNVENGYTSYKSNLGTIDEWIQYAKDNGKDAMPTNSNICTASLPKNVKEIFVVLVDTYGNTAYDIKEILPYYARSTFINKNGDNISIRNDCYSEELVNVKVSCSYDNKSYTEIKTYTKNSGITNEIIDIINVLEKEMYIKVEMISGQNQYIFIDKISF